MVQKEIISEHLPYLEFYLEKLMAQPLRPTKANTDGKVQGIKEKVRSE